MINKELLREYLSYNPDTGELVWIKNPSRGPKVSGKKFGSYLHGYNVGMFKRKSYKAHRLIWMWMTGSWPKKFIDHINGIRDDNRWCNLREADSTENQQNAKTPEQNKSGCKGVCWHKRDKKWIVNLKVNNKNYCFGAFVDFELAELVSSEARSKYHGAFARQ